MRGQATIYVIFCTPGYDTMRLHVNRSVLLPDGRRIPKQFVSNEDVFEGLAQALPEVKFVKRDLVGSPEGFQRLLGEIQQFKDEIDGIVLVGGAVIRYQGIDGPAQQPLAFTGLPTVYVDNLFKLQPMPYKVCRERGKVLFAEIDREGIMPPEKSAEMFEDLVSKVRMIAVLRKLRDAKILFIKSPESDIDGVDFKVLPPRYNEQIVARIAEVFGTEFVFHDVEDLIERFKAISDDDARPIAEMWKAGAVSVQEGIEGEIIKSAKLYLAIDAIREEHELEPVAMMVSGEYRALDEGVTTTTSLAMTEFQRRGIVGSYQSYTGTTLAQLFGWHLFGRMSFVHDDVVDIANNITLHMHCGTPVNNLWGEGELSYKIRDYTTGKWDEERGYRDGAVPAEVAFPVGVPVTIWKFFPMQRKITLYTGTSVDGEEVYGPTWPDIICRNKLPVKVEDAERIIGWHDVLEYGCHRCATFGDLRKPVKQLATLIGFEVEEWDR
jgi:hypothetical protein